MVRNWNPRLAVVIAAGLLVMLGVILGAVVIPSAATSGNVSANIVVEAAVEGSLTPQEQAMADLYTHVSPSVVSINVISRRAGSGFSDAQGIVLSSGSGFVINQQGYIVTNNHVVDGATDIEVNFFDGTIVRADLVGVDPDSDLAVVRVDLPAQQLQPVTFGDSDSLVIGQTALAIGSPFGQRWTLTQGIISALDRTLQGLTQYSVGSVIQTDAAINPGNSGGPLFNLQGQMIGVNSQILSQQRSNSGIGFAIPSNLVKRVATELISNGAVNYSLLGISSNREREITLSLIEAMSLPNNLRGVVVDNVTPSGPAQLAGLRNPTNARQVNGEVVYSSADIITAIDGIPLTGMSSLVSYLASSTVPGQTVNLTVWRDNQFVTVPVTLGSRR
ncbi:MAG: trypsin-like peptidase domain-containing protein [Anaerolineaceae bacterium]|nr:trypsin-like peptidase domain-containing protein [Anaerolineaceae bacterium]